MEELREIIAQNIIALRKTCDMTQATLAERLQYTDKAVSKWERAESVPDIAVLKAIADLFGVTVDYLITADHTNATAPGAERAARHKRRNRLAVTALSVLGIWLVATFVFVVMGLAVPEIRDVWLCFIYAVPLSFVTWLVFNTIWFKKRRNFLIVSFLMWTVLAALHLSFLVFGINIWLVYILGVPGQFMIFASAGVITVKKKERVKKQK